MLDRMYERGITTADIEYAIEAPDETGPCDNGGTRYLRENPDGRVLKVWTVVDGPVMVIKSAAWKGN
ncbi:DUF4258 domain-containing protein [Rhodococcoides fascians]|uniref:DUF4258 domain-containing protein n=1 Tax=Rhodococcoides fascians TaxID=1828 RepID=UPI00352FF648